MPLPLLFIGIAAVTGALGIGKSVKAAVDTNTANKTNQKANEIVDQAKIASMLLESKVEVVLKHLVERN